MSFEPTGRFPLGRPPAYSTQSRPPARARPLLWVVIIAAMVGWSLLAWLAYVSADPLIAWLGAGVTGLAEQGQGAAEALGGKQAGDAVRALDAGGFVGQLLSLAAYLAKPAIGVLWAVGMLGLLALPLLVSLARRVLGRLR